MAENRKFVIVLSTLPVMAAPNQTGEPVETTEKLVTASLNGHAGTMQEKFVATLRSVSAAVKARVGSDSATLTVPSELVVSKRQTYVAPTISSLS